jgi:hypothetical protein
MPNFRQHSAITFFPITTKYKNLAVDLDVFSQLLTSPVCFFIARRIKTEKRRIMQQDKILKILTG